LHGRTPKCWKVWGALDGAEVFREHPNGALDNNNRRSRAERGPGVGRKKNSRFGAAGGSRKARCWFLRCWGRFAHGRFRQNPMEACLADR